MANTYATMIGKPFLWTTNAYGTIAVHVTGFSPNGAVALFTIDGGEAATPAQRYAEMADGSYFGMPADLHKRPSTRKPRDASAEKALAAAAGVINTVPPVSALRKPRTSKRNTVTTAVPNRAQRRRTNEEVF